MKYEYIAADPVTGKGLQIIPRATTQEDQRFLTYLRNYLMGTTLKLRVTGCEHQEQSIPGLPDRPALALSLTLETEDGKPYIPQLGETLDPNAFVRQTGNPGKVMEHIKGKYGAKISKVPKSGRTIVEM